MNDLHTCATPGCSNAVAADLEACARCRAKARRQEELARALNDSFRRAEESAERERAEFAEMVAGWRFEDVGADRDRS